MGNEGSGKGELLSGIARQAFPGKLDYKIEHGQNKRGPRSEKNFCLYVQAT